ncbi:MAG: hypothetical protein Kow0090_11880 [Myxococcota bacterium]
MEEVKRIREAKWRWVSVYISLFGVLSVDNYAVAGLFEKAIGDSEGPSSATAISSAGSALEESLKLDINGFLRSAGFVGRRASEEVAELKAGYAEAGLKLSPKFGAYADGFSEVRFTLKVAEFGEASGEPVFDLREAYIVGYFGALDIKAGHQIIAWGRADGFNPTNNLTPRDMTVFSADEDDKRLGNFMLRMSLTFEPISIEGIIVPVYHPAKFPPFTFNSSMIDFSSAPTQVQPLLANMEILMDAPDYPDAAIENISYAGKISLILPSFDGSISYFRGFAPFPGIDGHIDVQNFVSHLIFKAYREHVAGFDFSTAIGGFLGVRGEAAFISPDDYERELAAPNPSLQYVLGIDKEMFSNFTLILQYIGKFICDYNTAFGSVASGAIAPEDMMKLMFEQMLFEKNLMISGQLKEVQHSISARVGWTMLYETLDFELAGMWNITTEEWMVRPMIVYDINDALNFSVGGELYIGPDETLFGLVDEMISAGFMELKFSF